MTAPMITDHAWRRRGCNGASPPERSLACAYMSCGRPREEHERATERGDLVQDGTSAAKAARS